MSLRNNVQITLFLSNKCVCLLDILSSELQLFTLHHVIVCCHMTGSRLVDASSLKWPANYRPCSVWLLFWYPLILEQFCRFSLLQGSQACEACQGLDHCCWEQMNFGVERNWGREKFVDLFIDRSVGWSAFKFWLHTLRQEKQTSISFESFMLEKHGLVPDRHQYASAEVGLLASYPHCP